MFIRFERSIIFIEGEKTTNSLIIWLGSQFQIVGVRDNPTYQLCTSINANAPTSEVFEPCVYYICLKN